MAYKKYIKRDGKIYGPYVYHSRRENGEVVTEYLGKKKHTTTFLLVISILVFIFGIYFFLSHKTTVIGNVALDIPSTYLPNETIRGLVHVKLQSGELIPSSSKVVVTLGGEDHNYSLKDLTSSSLLSSGDFYTTNVLISGNGEGFGVEGIKKTSTNVSFNLIIFDSGTEKNIQENKTNVPSSNASTSSSSNVRANVSSENGSSNLNVSSNNSTLETSNNLSSSNNSGSNQSSTSSEQAIQNSTRASATSETNSSTSITSQSTSSVSTETNTSTSTTATGATTQPANQQSTTTSEATTPATTSSTTSSTTTQPTPPSTTSSTTSTTPTETTTPTNALSGNIIKTITGHAIGGENSEVLGGVVSLDQAFSYTLPQGKSAGIQSGSVVAEGNSIDDSFITLNVINNIATVKTTYAHEDKGFGQEFLTNDTNDVVFNLSQLHLLAKDGTLDVKVIYNNTVIVETSKILQVSNVSESELLNIKNITKSLNLSLNELASYNLSLSEKDLLIKKTGTDSVRVTKSEVINGRLVVRFELGKYWLESSYNYINESVSLNETLSLVELEKAHWLKKLAEELAVEKEVPVNFDEIPKNYSI